jgi:hypothetical protein
MSFLFLGCDEHQRTQLKRIGSCGLYRVSNLYHHSTTNFCKGCVNEIFAGIKPVLCTSLHIITRTLEDDVFEYMLSRYPIGSSLYCFKLQVVEQPLSETHLLQLMKLVTQRISPYQFCIDFRIEKGAFIDFFASDLRTNPTIRFLIMSNMNLSSDHAKKIMGEIADNPIISQLFIQFCVRKKDKICVKNLLSKMPSLRFFEFKEYENEMSDVLAGLPLANALEKVHLSSHSFENAIVDAVPIFEAVSKSNTIKAIDFSDNILDLSTEESQKIPEFVKNSPNLVGIDFSFCRLGRNDLDVILKIIKNDTLSYLSVAHNNFTGSDLLNIVSSVGPSLSLRELDLGTWKWDQGVMTLLGISLCIMNNTSLFDFIIDGHNYGNSPIPLMMDKDSIHAPLLSLIHEYLLRNRHNDTKKRSTLVGLLTPLLYLPKRLDHLRLVDHSATKRLKAD